MLSIQAKLLQQRACTKLGQLVLGRLAFRSSAGARSLSPCPRPTHGKRPAEDACERACERGTGCAYAMHERWASRLDALRAGGAGHVQDQVNDAASRAQSAACAASGTPRSPLVRHLYDPAMQSVCAKASWGRVPIGCERAQLCSLQGCCACGGRPGEGTDQVARRAVLHVDAAL